MQEDPSNGEATFEFVEKKSGGTPKKSDGLLAVNLLSNVAPPSDLPSFVIPPAANPVQSTNDFHPRTLNYSAEMTVNSQPTVASRLQREEVEAEDVDLEEGSVMKTSRNLIGWMKGAVGTNGILSRVAEKAKNSVDSMITTLDPQMKEFLSSSNAELEVVVASGQEVKISPIREAFQLVFPKVNVRGLDAQSSHVAKQPIGFKYGLQAAWERVESVRAVQPKGLVVAVENFIVEIVPDRWYDVGAIVLSDVELDISLEAFTQLSPIPSAIITLAQDDTPPDYPLRTSGFAVTAASLLANSLKVMHQEPQHGCFPNLYLETRNLLLDFSTAILSHTAVNVGPCS